jgi:type II restriction/modification system DNA methylase subunit YeeA
VWIGEIQWMLKNGYPIRTSPILQALDHIEHRDALLVECSDASLQGAVETAHSKICEAEWPSVDVIIGNPPFLGGSKMLRELGDDYVHALRVEYEGRVPGGADLVTYWFEKARAHIEAGKSLRAGLVATNSIRGGSNQEVLAKICDSAHIFNAWSDEEWINEGAAVRVSLVCFGISPSPSIPLPAGEGSEFPSPSGRGARGEGITLNGAPVSAIHADLTAGEGLNLTQAKSLAENAGVAFQGPEKNGAFDIEGELARQWLKLPNPNGRSNSDVLKPRYNGLDLARRYSGGWVIDFGTSMNESDASLYEVPFQHVLENVKPERDKNKDRNRRIYWWRFGRTGEDMRTALNGLPRYIVTPEVTKHRIFAWLDASVLADKKLIAIARSDDTTFGILHSRFHELWSLAVCSWHGAGNDARYTPTTTFETFPFPEGYASVDATLPHPSPLPAGEGTRSPRPMGEGLGVRESVAAAAKSLNELRNNWLNPPEWTDWVRTPEEEKAGYPLRPIAKAGHEADLKKRTLTNLYNQRPAWLDNAHKTLDTAVAQAYGWNDYTPDMPDEEILRRLLVLNLERAE